MCLFVATIADGREAIGTVHSRGWLGCRRPVDLAAVGGRAKLEKEGVVSDVVIENDFE